MHEDRRAEYSDSGHRRDRNRRSSGVGLPSWAGTSGRDDRVTDRGGWEERFAEAYRSTYPALVAYCRRRLTSDRVDDAVADIYTVAWDKRDQFLGADTPLAWLYGVGFRVVSSEYRRARRHRLLGRRLSHHETPRFVQPPDAQAADADEIERAFQAMATLRVEDQELIALAAFEDLSYRQIAEVTGRSESSARSALHRARQRLRDAHEQSGGGSR